MGIRKYFFQKDLLIDKEEDSKQCVPCEIRNRLHYLSIHAKKEYCVEKAEYFNECVRYLIKIAEYYSYDIYIDDGDDTMVGIVKLISNKILLYDEYVQHTNMDIMSMFKKADEVIVEEINVDSRESRPALVLKFYLYKIIQK